MEYLDFFFAPGNRLARFSLFFFFPPDNHRDNTSKVTFAPFYIFYKCTWFLLGECAYTELLADLSECM
jgi:hypothetical protein